MIILLVSFLIREIFVCLYTFDALATQQEADNKTRKQVKIVDFKQKRMIRLVYLDMNVCIIDQKKVEKKRKKKPKGNLNKFIAKKKDWALWP